MQEELCCEYVFIYHYNHHHIHTLKYSRMCLLLRLEELSGAFSTVLGTAIAISGFMYYKFYQHTHNIFIGKRNVDYDEAQQLQSVTKVLQDVGSLEVGW